MATKELWVVVARYSDGSVEAELLAAFEDQFSADKLAATVRKCFPSKEVTVSAVQMWPEIKADVGDE